MELPGKVALVTGSAKRIGKALALGLAERGCHVVIHYNSSSAEATRTLAESSAMGVNAWLLEADLASEQSVLSVIPKALNLAGRLDILVNNASVFLPGNLLDMTLASWQRDMDVNLRAPFVLSQSFAKCLPLSPHGKIINILDSDAMRPKNHHFSYTISKFGLAGLTKATAVALGHRNIQVNGIAPGLILPNENATDTDRIVFDRMAKRTPAGRPVDVQSVVDALLYLIKADYATGEIIRVDGGQHL